MLNVALLFLFRWLDFLRLMNLPTPPAMERKATSKLLREQTIPSDAIDGEAEELVHQVRVLFLNVGADCGCMVEMRHSIQ